MSYISYFNDKTGDSFILNMQEDNCNVMDTESLVVWDGAFDVLFTAECDKHMDDTTVSVTNEKLTVLSDMDTLLESVNKYKCLCVAGSIVFNDSSMGVELPTYFSVESCYIVPVNKEKLLYVAKALGVTLPSQPSDKNAVAVNISSYNKIYDHNFIIYEDTDGTIQTFKYQ